MFLPYEIGFVLTFSKNIIVHIKNIYLKYKNK
jgi:hypothetical protein